MLVLTRHTAVASTDDMKTVDQPEKMTGCCQMYSADKSTVV